MHTFIQGRSIPDTAERKGSEEPPPKQKEDDESDAGERSVLRHGQRLNFGITGRSSYLLHQQFPVDAHCCSSVLLAVLPQTSRELTHPLQAVPTVQEILDVLGHHLGDIAQLVVQLVEVL